MEEESRAEVPRISAPPTGTLPLEVFFMDSLTPFIRHELEDRPGVSAAPEAACSRCSPPLGKEPGPVQLPSTPDGPEEKWDDTASRVRGWLPLRAST